MRWSHLSPPVVSLTPLLLPAAARTGAWAELDVDTRAPPGLQPRRTEVLLSHLRSSAGMGTAEVRCAAGCACAPSVLDGTTAARVSVFKVHAFQVRLLGEP